MSTIESFSGTPSCVGSTGIGFGIGEPGAAEPILLWTATGWTVGSPAATIFAHRQDLLSRDLNGR